MSARRYLLADFGNGLVVMARCTRWLPNKHRDYLAGDDRKPNRWWLVECESADAGRRAIRCNGTTACEGPGPLGCEVDESTPGACPYGRILDSGGAS